MDQIIRRSDGKFKAASRSTIVALDPAVALESVSQTSKPDPFFAVESVVAHAPQTVSETVYGHQVSLTF
jgi:hypothetical protein